MNDQISTGTDLAVVNEQPRPKPQLLAGHKPTAIVPIDFDGAYRIANVVTQAGMAPKTLQTVEKAMVAILHGLEVGLTPMNALQSIAVINGRPTIWGDGAIGLIRASGLLEYMEERFEEEGDKLVAVCIVKRKGEPRPVRGEFSMADAKQAGLLKKEGPWQTYPRRMMQMRARWPLRDVFADVLKGLSLREEVEDMDTATPARAAAVAPPPPTEMIEHKPELEQEAATLGDAVAPPPPKDDGLDIPADLQRKKPKVQISDDERDWLLGLGGAFSGTESIEDLQEQEERLMAPHMDKFSDEAKRQAKALLNEHAERLTGQD